MSEQITLQVSDEVIRHAASIAACNQQSVEKVLADLLESAIYETPVELLSDEEVVALTELRLPPEQEARLSELLAGHREGELNDDEKRELDRLMKIYERGILRQSKALREAVARGLRGPLEP
ncbi:MAG TPA: hypothetical protein VNQ79_18880 [Blastocatellia bacterium]|nr:hypothetical protein [Blastocatellia bacterium]